MSHFTYLHISGQRQPGYGAWMLGGEMPRDAPIPACPSLQSHKSVTLRARAAMEITDVLSVNMCTASKHHGANCS